jgi:HAD superfamily hydrolase (TIGR01549 family)
MGVRGVIFDLGHTLMGLDGTWPEIFDRGRRDLSVYLAEHQVGLDAPAFAQALIDRRTEMFAQARATRREVTAEASMRWTFARFGLPNPDAALVLGAIDAFFAYEESRWLAYPEAVETLQTLARRGMRMGMFSNATHDPFIQRLVDRLGFRPFLRPAMSSAGTGIRKPDPLAFTPILEQWALPPDAVAVVGDTLEADILGAKQAGMRSVWIRAREDARQEGHAAASNERGPVLPDVTIANLSELPDCLETL